jgi:SMODS and SLOG-associating 2TM effector domain 2
VTEPSGRLDLRSAHDTHAAELSAPPAATEPSAEPARPATRRRGVDLDLAAFPPLTWSRNEIRRSLDELYAWSERLATDAINWYLTEKRRKARRSRGLRALALLLATAGGAVPIIALAAGRAAAGNWGFLLLALAAGCWAFDRFFGYSSSWLRYMATATSLRTQLVEYQTAWAKEMVAMAAREPDRTDAVRLIDFVRTFAWNVNDTIRAETEAWLVEFHTRLTELESRLQQSEGGLIRRGGAPGVSLPGPGRSPEDGASRVRFNDH